MNNRRLPLEDDKERNFGREIDGLQRPRTRRNRRLRRYKHTTNEIRRKFICLATIVPIIVNHISDPSFPLLSVLCGKHFVEPDFWTNEMIKRFKSNDS